jgi:hypothetical protein
MSSTDCWLAPSSPRVMPPWEPTNLAFTWGLATPMRSWSKVLHIRKLAKELAKGISPVVAMPAAMPARLASAMPTFRKRSGKALAKPLVLVDLERSASSTTTLGLRLPSSTRASP